MRSASAPAPPAGSASICAAAPRWTRAPLFQGYDALAGESLVVALLKDGAPVEELKAGESGEVVLEATPFYAESGGQVGDAGELAGAGMRFVVSDTHEARHGLRACRQGGRGAASASATRSVRRSMRARRAATALNHSATHLLHAALRQVLGTHVQQKGSLVAPDRLRFDFSHFQAVSRRRSSRPSSAW